MKHLVRRLEAEPLAGTVIQPVLDHGQLFIRDGFHAPLLGNVLAQQAVEIFIAASLPAAVRISKIGLDAQGPVNGLVVGKLLAIIHRQGLDARLHRHELAFDGTPDLLGCLAAHLGQHGIAAFAFHQSHNGLFVRGSNHGIALPVTNLLAQLNVSGSLADGTSMRNLTAPVACTAITLAPGLLTAQVLVQFATSGLVRIDMQINAFVTHLQSASNLFGTPLQAKVEGHIGPDMDWNTSGIAAATGAFSCLAAGLFGAIAALPLAAV